jgi:hypothetical protein
MDHQLEVTREQIAETRAALSDKLQTLKHRVVDTVQDAANTVTETVQKVKFAVHESVKNVKDTFDLRLQVNRRPWGIVAGSIALGYLSGYLLLRNGSARPQTTGRRQPAPPPSDKLRIAKQQNGVAKRHGYVEGLEKKFDQDVADRPSEPGSLSLAPNRFESEIRKLKGLAIGTVLSLVRDLITEAAQEPTKGVLTEVMDSITVKLGGEPIRGPVLKNNLRAKEQNNEYNAWENRRGAGGNSAANSMNRGDSCLTM